ncbi:MAG: TRAP transporter substrate-binding protein DctP [Lautropia sp.]
MQGRDAMADMGATRPSGPVAASAIPRDGRRGQRPGSALLAGAVLASALGVSVFAPATADAQQKLTLRVADVYPTGHPVAQTTARFFMDEVRKASNGMIDFEYFPAQQLGKGKDLLSLTQAGVADIGLIVPSYISDKMPLSAVTELPGAFKSSCEGTMALWKLATGGVLASKEFGSNGVRVLIAHAFAPFQLVTTKPFDGLSSLEGQKMRSLGAVMDSTIRRLKATPIRIPAPEINEAMSRGTIDGGLMGYPTVLSYDLARIVKAGTAGANFGGATITYAISEKKWKTLDEKTQKVLLAAGEAATRNGCKHADDAIAPSADKLTAAGVKLSRLSEQDQKKLDETLTGVGNDWAKELDARGKPGTEVLEAFRGALRAGG